MAKLKSYRPGGLMRCCIKTLLEDTSDDDYNNAKDGTVIHCNYCSSSMVFQDDVWAWNRPKDIYPK